jgi:hypothetical protein
MKERQHFVYYELCEEVPLLISPVLIHFPPEFSDYDYEYNDYRGMGSKVYDNYP